MADGGENRLEAVQTTDGDAAFIFGRRVLPLAGGQSNSFGSGQAVADGGRLAGLQAVAAV
ncbi:hypothetical protein [uncultured Deinococcus sp.]|uniref:hypothetical protein n=1 Tax=uncultured Deinococcus sp. TaxID=158789 RepID=UPI003749225D